MLAMFERKALISAVLLPLIVGLAGMVHLLDEPGSQAIRTVAVVQLTGSGFCFGIAFAALVAMIRLKRES
jgi:hypothetical protein